MAYVFKIKIVGLSKPTVWRRLVVPEHFTFDRFHQVIQVAFGWENIHLYKFSDSPYGGSFEISVPAENAVIDFYHPAHRMDALTMKLSDYFSEDCRRLIYLYDFGDDWVHDILLEEITPECALLASCVKGKGACPPEDVGGVISYEAMKTVFREYPESEEAANFAEWLWLAPDEEFDPDEFCLKVVNLSVHEV